MEDNKQAKELPSVSLLEKIEYGFGGMFKTGLGGYIANLYWMFFLTDVVGISTVLAATAKTAVTFIKLALMMFTGALVDGTNFKTGRYRTWILIGDIVMFIMGGLLFLKYDYKSQVGYIVVLLIIYAIQIMGYNVSWTSARAVVGLMAVNTADSVGLTAAASVGSHAAGVVYGVLVAFAMKAAANTSNQYMFASYIMGVIYLIGTAVMWNLTKKYELGDNVKYKTAQKQEKIPFKDMLIVFKGPGKWLFLSSSIMNIASGMQSVLLVYYTRYILQNDLMLGYGVTASSISAVLAALISPKLCAKFSKKGVYAFSMFSGAISYAAYYFIGSNGYLYILIRVIYQFCATPVATAMVSMANDVADYHEMRGAKSAKAFSQSMLGVTIRVGSLISTAAASFGLAAIGYTAGVQPTGDILNAIILMMSFVPAAAYALGGLLILFYKVDEKELEEYKMSKVA